MRDRYGDSIWWAMHHSDDPERRSLAITCYLDESATDGGTPAAVVGGVILNKTDYVELDSAWRDLLDDLNLRPSLHMKDFGQHGRFADIALSQSLEIFERATVLIGKHRAYTICATLNHPDYREAFSERTRRDHSVYEICFIVAALGVGRLAKLNDYPYSIPYIVDSGNPYAEQVRLAHAEMDHLSSSTGFPPNIGSLTFGDDARYSPLQVSDLICWAARRQLTNTAFPSGMASLETLLSGPQHVPLPVEKKGLIELESYFRSRREKR